MTDTILIVDDSTFIVDGLVALLKKSYQPIPSYGGEECIEILRKVTPSLIILDIMMEPMDGWETLSRIKKNPKTRHIPVLMFSAKKISPEEAETHRIIIDDFLTKPVNPKKLLEAIEKVLSRQGFNRRIIDTWNAAGVSPEIIDEYLSLKTNLDVDVSLLLVMKKQLDMAHPDAMNRDDLVRSIAALEERIGASRARIDAFCHERAGVLPAYDKGVPPVSPATAPLPVPGPSASPPDSALPLLSATGSPVIAEAPPVPAEAVSSGAEPEESLPEQKEKIHAPFPNGVADAPLPEEVLSPAAESPSPSEVILPTPGPGPALPPVPGTGTQQDVPVSPVPLAARGEISLLRIPPEAAVAGGKPEPDGAARSSLFEPFGTTAEERTLSGPMQPVARGEPVNTPRRGMSAGSGDQSPPAPGAGTQTPSMRSPKTTSRVQNRGQDEERGSRTTPPSPGGNIFSRILVAIAGIFRRK